MQLFQNQGPALQTVTAYGGNSVTINGVRFTRSILILPGAGPVSWPAPDFENLSRDDFSTVFAFRPDLLLVGTGTQQRFIPPRLLAEFSSEKIGVESMNNPAACRTFNLLLAEGRHVALALFMENGT